MLARAIAPMRRAVEQEPAQGMVGSGEAGLHPGEGRDEVLVPGIETPQARVVAVPGASPEQVEKAHLPVVVGVRPPLELGQVIDLVLDDVGVLAVARQDEHRHEPRTEVGERVGERAQVLPQVEEGLIGVLADHLPDPPVVVGEDHAHETAVLLELGIEGKQRATGVELGAQGRAQQGPAPLELRGAPLGELEDGSPGRPCAWRTESPGPALSPSGGWRRR